MKKVLKIIGKVFTTALVVVEFIAVIVLVLTRLSGGVPSVMGYTFSVVVTPSMEPTINVGDVIFSRLYDGSETLEKGDIITYTGQGGEIEGLSITHRITEIDRDNQKLVTKGDANIIPDEEISLSDVRAVMKYKTVVIGPLYRAINTAPGFLLLVVLPIVLVIVLEIISFINAAKAEIYNETKGEKKQ